ncbi:hypothetical protein G6F24_018926 [Rhizopus arrhizus]|nr:hypothetical protein G6F24_018926 [Rhizopus arrhizus]
MAPGCAPSTQSPQETVPWLRSRPPVWPTRSNTTWPAIASPPVSEDSWRCSITRSSAGAWSSPTPKCPSRSPAAALPVS